MPFAKQYTNLFRQVGNAATPVNQPLYAWAGGLTPTGLSVAAKLSNTTSTAKLAISTSPSMTSPSFGAAATADASTDFWCQLVSPTLTADTVYYWAVADGTTISTNIIGTFRTPKTAGTAMNFKVVVGGDMDTDTDTFVLEALRDEAAFLFIMLGDLHYNDYNGTDLSVRRGRYERLFNASRWQTLMNSFPWAYTWDDHDFCGNSSASASAGKNSAIQVFRQCIPHYAWAGGSGTTDPVYQTWRIGRVNFMMLDTMSGRITGTQVIDSTQQTWLVNQVSAGKTAGCKLHLIISSITVPGSSGSGWDAFTVNRAAMLDALYDAGLNTEKIVFMSGDAHMLAYHDGTTTYGTAGKEIYAQSVCCAPLHQVGSIKGGDWAYTREPAGTFPDNDGQYAVLNITDAGGGSFSASVDLKSVSPFTGAVTTRLTQAL